MPYMKSFGKTCVVVGCTNNKKKIYEWKNAKCDEHESMHFDCPCIQPFTFHCLPKDEERRQSWLKAINRKDFRPKGKELVCSVDFIDGRPTQQNPDPAVNLGYEKKVKPGRRHLIRLPLSSVHCTVQNQENQNDGYDELSTSPLQDITTNTTSTCVSVGTQTDPVLCHFQGEPCKTTCRSTQDKGTQTMDNVTLDHCYSFFKPTYRSTGTQHSSVDFSVGNISSDSDARFFTGLSLNVLICLINVLKPLGKKMPFRLPIGDQILLTLTRLRLGCTFMDIGRRFGISPQITSEIFQKWISIMAFHLKDCILWLPRETIRRTMPKSFRDSYPKTTCIIDCTEIYTQRPFCLKARSMTWSTYKSHNTVKYLIAIAPNGYVMYISSGYGGRASDNYITKSSGFLNHLLPGDEIMADRGFTIGEDLFARRVNLNIPSFMKGRSQLSETETIESRRIASVRIHVERAIARLKT